jgi:hypothetical protein
VGASPAFQKVAIVTVALAYGGLFGWLLADTLHHSGPFDPRPVQANVIPILAGALGLVLALALGVDPNTRIQGTGLVHWLRQLLAFRRLLLFGALVYLASAIAGGVVWGIKDNTTPTLVTAVVLLVAGYFAGAVTAATRGG